jgi:Pectate lyase superfamily protein
MRIKAYLAAFLLLLSVTAHAQFTPGQILTAAQLNGAFSNVLPVSGGTLTGPLTVPSLSVTGAPIPLASGGTGANTAIGATSSIQFLNSNSGASARAVSSKLQDVVNVLDFGADPTGATDSTTAFSNAMASLGTSGGVVKFRGWFLINSALNIPDNVFLVGYGVNTGQRHDGAYIPANFPSALILNPSITITLNSRDGVTDALILTTALAPGGSFALPFANATVAANAVAAFSGTAFTPTAQNFDERLENLLVLGFQKIYDGSAETESNRPLFRRVYGDATNGFYVQNVSDIGRGEDLHMWPFTTANQTFTTNTLLLRSGTAYYTGTASTWMTWRDAFEYGWAIGHDVEGTQDVRQISCGADSPATGTSQTNIGFQYGGALANVQCIGCTATAQGGTGFLLNTTSQNNVNDVKLIGPVAHGNNSANGYVDVKSGTYSITGGFFDDNGSVGHIQIESGAGAGTISDTTFGNLTTAAPIFGNAAAIAKLQVLNIVLTGTVSSTLSNTLISPGTNSALALFSSGSGRSLQITDTGASGANVKLIGNGGTTPSKAIRASSGQLQFLNDAYSAVITSISDTGRLQVFDGLALTITTVAALPTCGSNQKGLMYAVSDATSPTYNGALTGGGAVSVPVYCNGTSWSSH